MRSDHELKLLQEISDLTFLRFAYKRNSKNSLKTAQSLINVMDKLKSLAGFILIDCENFTPKESQICKELEYVSDSFPRLKLMIPPEKKIDPHTREITYHYEYPWTEKEITENNLYKFIHDNIPNKAKKLSTENLDVFLESDAYNKLILFTQRSTQSVLWRGLTNNLHDKILFGEVSSSLSPTDAKVISERFTVTNYPTLVVYKTFDNNYLVDDPQIIKYEGTVDVDSIIQWLQPHLLREKRYISQKRGIDEKFNEDRRNESHRIFRKT
jgi:hypothetical protein